MQRLTFYIAAVAVTLAGCSGHYVSSAEKTAVDQMKTITGDDELCQALATVNSAPAKSGGVATMQREDFDVYYAQKTYLKQRIAARDLDCSKPKTKNTQTVAPVEELNPRQEQARVSATCSAIAQRSQFADPNVAYEMCGRGYKATSKKCSHDIAGFTEQSQQLTGAARAEYLEIGSAFRVGCNLKVRS
ncbi:hypothetical protein [Yersinia pseudotuberculosis]|uniref:hypothetical protein n=1 Tax=Yersinia pseudotuberculosis TaxID=633 RepID=UPI00061CB7C9|nr:hypothetical protein [Yersinia pseudotuberculosis]AXY34746.1 hypothetical protein CEQ20_16065 [Yersinia pseudotuberculosis]AYX10349.1 hypothetical protein EGX52_05755 [Yersinia pseudotuberculosis]MBO1568041.1 hypothetical protein [Yersinia pseudotuberculosis]MBO1604870.1 hypothetical protein [Yersinia pseudotuberculosis]PEI14314.1 hypothetical protein CRM78_14485 [Yersinia pseudotuberculosis]